MTYTSFDDIDLESLADDDGEEDSLGAEDVEWDTESDDEAFSSRATRRRRQRARQIAAARARQRARAIAARGAARGRTAARPPAPRTAAAAVRQLDLKTSVQEDNVRQAIAAQNKRMTRSEWAAVVGVAATSLQTQEAFQEKFPGLKNRYAKAILSSAPLALLSPRKRGTGFGSVASDPRVIGFTLAVGIAFAGERLSKEADRESAEAERVSREAGTADITIDGSKSVAPGQTVRLLWEARDARNRLIPNMTFTFVSDNPAIAVNRDTGAVTATANAQVGETAFITGTTSDGFPRSIVVTVG